VLQRPLLVAVLGLVCAGCSGAQPAPSTPTSASTVAAKPTAAVAASLVPTIAAVAASPSPVASRAPAVAAAPSPGPTTAPVPVTASRIETLTAANAAFARGDNAAAADLYDRVVNTPRTPAESAEIATTIEDFARFRSLVSLLAARREGDARDRLNELQDRDPNAPFARLAAQLWDQYSMTGQLRAACAQVQPQIASQAGPALAALQAAGVGGLDPTSLCAPPSQGGGY
jgi:hypothetical protein